MSLAIDWATEYVHPVDHAGALDARGDPGSARLTSEGGHHPYFHVLLAVPAKIFRGRLIAQDRLSMSGGGCGSMS